LVLNDDADVYNEEGKLLMRFRKQVLSEEKINSAYEGMKNFIKNSSKDRGIASGSKPGTPTGKKKEVTSNILGFFDRWSPSQKRKFRDSGRKAELDVRPCRFNMENPEKYQHLLPLLKEIDQWRSTNCLSFKNDKKLIKPQFVVQTLHQVTKGDAFITSDVGQHQMWAAQYYPFDKPRRWINSGGLGTMGVGLPYAMGTQLAHPDAMVACVTGEASIQMCIQELSTCKQFHLPIKIINLNNRYMGMVRQWQEFFYGNRYAESYMEALPDFVKLAEAYGHVGMKIENPSDIEPALKEAFSKKLKERLVFMDFITDQKENVFPMIPNGKGLSEMITAEDL
jgi:acetolactate synthase-1/2/3 large subunit